MSKEKVLVICPGRGTYNKGELGYLHRHNGNKTRLVQEINQIRHQLNQDNILELDSLDK